MKGKFKNYDFFLLFIVFFLIGWSVLNIYSATVHEYSNLYIKQGLYGLVSVFILLLFPLINYRKVVHFAPFIYVLGVVMLLSVFLFGVTILGAKRWISLGFFTIQPSEFMKYVVILITAYILGVRKEKVDLKTAIIVLLIVSVPFVLTLKQPDLGTALTILIPVVFMLFAGGISHRYIVAGITAVILSSPFIWEHMKDYQKERILAFIDPQADPFKSAYHLIQSKIAIGSGGITGKGFMHGTQSKLFFLPEQHTDFIFATIGEEWGFVFSSIILTIYLIVGLRMLYWSNKIRDDEGKYILIGTASLIVLQAFINIAMTVGMAPVVGITLPFLSYGGSSMVAFSLMVATALSVIRVYREEKLHF
ncbi:rod shape-determining protein RodA [Persephonella atlantica]|uniref:Peptidoglycan glycosyltransferase RodA n=1 Tax=Persephonella atlantica TaxID=2699429 RepID=A0ABS1GJQ5_9AQUI|nr:rod shape-determining protein RodA [Persephonella atlantica]MBK3333163.1 rod shape-determining protein RodA [Persephonella atlantica]